MKTKRKTAPKRAPATKRDTLFRILVDGVCEKRKATYGGLADACGISSQYLSLLMQLQDGRKCGDRIVRQLAEGLRVSQTAVRAALRA